ncbi:MAG: leucyl aminopeptidase, partial [Chloroflexota bacterium]
MQVRVEPIAVTEIVTPLIVVNLFEGVEQPGGATGAVDEALGGLIRQLARRHEINTDLGQVTVLYNLGQFRGLAAERVAVVGLGKQGDFDCESARVAAAAAARKARDLKLDRFATIVHGAGIGGLDPADATQAVAEASVLALFTLTEFKSPAEKPPTDVLEMTIVEHDPERAARMRGAAEVGAACAEATMITRRLSSSPANYCTPEFLADQAREICDRYGHAIEVFGKEDLERMGFGGVLAVNQGSALPPRFAVMRYTSPRATRTLAVVGKGITFDTGGISLKPAEGMEWMRHDMSGAAATIGFMDLMGRLKPDVNIIGLFAATENMPSGTAYKPGDVIRAYNGKMMDILNTDAEGRVTLADVLAYAVEQKPDAIVDMATLTGACVVALGYFATGILGNNEDLIDQMRRAGDASGERVWPLPLWPVYHKQIESPLGDIKNTGGRPAGTITAAAFLQNFVSDVPWVHLDIAGTAYSTGDKAWIPPYQNKNESTGIGVRLLYHF